MNIVLQCCALAMLVVLLLIYTREKRLDLTSRRLFFWALAACVICVSLDILSIAGIYAAENGLCSSIVAQIVCKLYLVSLVLQGYFGFLYASGEFFAVHAYRRLRNLYRGAFFIGSILILLLPLSYYMNGQVVYSYGPAAVTAYAVAMLFIGSTSAMAFQATQITSPRRRWCILLWQAFWVISALIQFLFPQLLLVGFAAAFGMVLIFSELENPHDGIDSLTGQFSASALISYTTDLYQREEPFSSIQIRTEFLTENVNLDTEKAVMLRISGFLSRLKGVNIFRKTDNSFVLVMSTPAKINDVLREIVASIDDTIDMPVRLSYIIMPDSKVFLSADEYFHSHHYCEKQAIGQECYIVDAETVAGMRSYNEVNDLINSALAENRVEVFFQPIYNVQKRYFSAAEALVRIRDVDGSIVPPGKFIPVAEENGSIVPLGIEIFRQVCEFLATGKPQQLGLEYIEVNLSVAQFDRDNPAEFVQRLMDRYRVDSKLINLEITETASNSAKQILLRNMNKLIKRGVHFSLDDFGTGRSNLDYFVEMPVDIIKFDFSFTQGYFKSAKARYVVESVIELMHKMGLPIVAEGVETKEQLDTMCELGISFIQGFYFSRPIPRGELLDFLAANNLAS